MSIGVLLKIKHLTLNIHKTMTEQEINKLAEETYPLLNHIDFFQTYPLEDYANYKNTIFGSRKIFVTGYKKALETHKWNDLEMCQFAGFIMELIEYDTIGVRTNTELLEQFKNK